MITDQAAVVKQTLAVGVVSLLENWDMSNFGSAGCA
jgi:hypothetical protein